MNDFADNHPHHDNEIESVISLVITGNGDTLLGEALKIYACETLHF